MGKNLKTVSNFIDTLLDNRWFYILLTVLFILLATVLFK